MTQQRYKPVDFLLVATTATFFLLIRKYDAFVNPQLWAEDGTVFLQQAEELGATALITPYAGYFHAVLRLIAGSFSVLGVNYLYIPACYNASAWLVTLFVCDYLYRCALRQHFKYPLAFAISFLALPLGSEIYMNLTNLNWIIALVLICYLFIGYEQGEHNSPFRFKTLCWYTVILLISLTGPCSLLLSPLIVLKLFLQRKQFSVRRFIPLGLILLGGGVQFVCIKFIQPGVSRTYDSGESRELHLLRFFEANAKEQFFLHSAYFSKISPNVLNIVALILSLGLVFLIYKAYRRINIADKYFLPLTGLLFLASFIAVFWPNEADILSLRCPRYYFVPYACLVWLLITGFQYSLKAYHFSLYLVIWCCHLPFLQYTLPNKEWKSQIDEYYAGLRSEVTINPDPWNVKLPLKNMPFLILDHRNFNPEIKFVDADTVIALWGGSVESNPVNLPAGRYHITLATRGTPCSGQFPRLHLLVNNTEAGLFESNLTSYFVSDSFEFETERDSLIRVKIRMDNDASNNGEDRNAFIRRIFIYKQ